MATSSFPRRFKVEPIETTVASSKDRSPRDREDRKCARKFPPELVETTTKTIRKFAPEPVETVVRSSKDKAGAGDERSSRTRRFAPEPVETSTRINRRSEPEDEGLDKKRRSSKKFAEEWNDWESQLTFKSGKKEKRPSRKFVPQLIETARRSRRAGDACPTLRPSDKTEATPTAACSAHITIDTTSFKVPSPPANTPTFDYSHNPLFLEIQRATSPFSGRRSLPRRASKHCFQVPELDPIESSESEAEESAPSSPTTSPSISDRPSFYKEATRMRESVDDRFAGYLLKLAADAAEKQLREQALAAFPNDDFHEHVDHWMGREDTVSSDGDPQSRRDSSFNQVNWELVAMRKHREKLEQQREEELELERRREIEKKQNAWTQVAAQGDSSPKDIVGGYQKDDELDRMRKRARPPMLGKDIKFPRCPSPEPARFDTTQGCDVVRKAMCYLSEQSQAAEEKGESLWCGNGNGRQVSKVPSLWSTGSSRSASRSGLWGGCCVTSGETPPRGPTGILTPSNEKGNPVDTPCPTPSTYLLPPTPPASHADFACIDEKLAAELTIEEEYGDDFVTQVYNYLSLGYPVMARPFDEELSKISHIPVSELRQDDHLAQSRGYIRLGADGNLSSAEITEESCMRWRALRVYIREWAKQQPGMAGETIAGGMGTAVRRGSWAV